MENILRGIDRSHITADELASEVHYHPFLEAATKGVLPTFKGRGRLYLLMGALAIL